MVGHEWSFFFVRLITMVTFGCGPSSTKEVRVCRREGGLNLVSRSVTMRVKVRVCMIEVLGS